MPERRHNSLLPEDYGRLLGPCLAQAAGYARSILRDRADAEDAVQQAAMRGLERLGTFDTGRSFKGWWFAILRHCCIDMLRHAKAARTVALDENQAAIRDESDSSRWEILAEAVKQLSPEHRETLSLRYFGGLSYREIAAALEIPEGTVMSRLYCARQALARQISLEDL